MIDGYILVAETPRDESRHESCEKMCSSFFELALEGRWRAAGLCGMVYHHYIMMHHQTTLVFDHGQRKIGRGDRWEGPFGLVTFIGAVVYVFLTESSSSVATT